MTRRARWIGIGVPETASLRTLCEGLAQTQARDADPIVIWGKTSAHLCLCDGIDEVWVDEGQHVFVLIVPLRLAPGRSRRWIAWALAPAIAACRVLGVRAYFEGRDLWVAGRRAAGAGCATIGACAVIVSSLPHASAGGTSVAARLREAIEAQFGWQFETSWPSTAERQAIGEAR